MPAASGSPDNPPDEELARLCAVRPVDEEAWTAFYRRFYDFVRSQVKRTLKGSPADADDLVQIGFVQIFKALPSYDRNKAQLRTYLSRVVTNAVIDVLRHGHGPSSTLSLDNELVLLQVRAETDPALLRAVAEHVVDRLGDQRKIDIIGDLIDGRDVNEICVERKATQYEVYTARKWLRNLLLEMGGAVNF